MTPTFFIILHKQPSFFHFLIKIYQFFTVVTCFRSISTTSLEILVASFFNCSILASVSCSNLFTFAPESPLVCFHIMMIRRQKKQTTLPFFNFQRTFFSFPIIYLLKFPLEVLLCFSFVFGNLFLCLFLGLLQPCHFCCNQ